MYICYHNYYFPGYLLLLQVYWLQLSTVLAIILEKQFQLQKWIVGKIYLGNLKLYKLQLPQFPSSFPRCLGEKQGIFIPENSVYDKLESSCWGIS